MALCSVHRLGIALVLAGAGLGDTFQPAAGQNEPRKREPQPRAHGMRVAVPVTSLLVDDGDTFDIVWAPGDTETVRILGIDTPETRHDAHSIPEDQPGGPEARAFARGAVAFSDKAELLRSNSLDPYGRTLGYFFLDERNYSVSVVTAKLAFETVTHYGDNGFPVEAKAVLQAATAAGKPAFEPPHEFRRRMRARVQGAGKQ
jgi:endonuclease YncB( thermonuclease family)